MDTWDETFLGRIFCIRKGRQQFQSGREWPMLEAYIREDAKDEEEESLIGHHNDQDALRRSTPFNIALYVTSTSILICSIVFYLLMYFHAPSDSACERMNWAWSPMMEELKYEWRQYDSDSIPDVYAGPPTEERREAWRLTHEQGWIAFPDTQLAVLNKSKDERKWWRLPPPKQDQLVALPEVVHQSHCVGWLYLFAYRAEWDYHILPNMKEEIVFKLHANHCFLALMRMVTCEADITPVLFQKDVPGGLGAWKTRDAPHRCKKWDVLEAWQEEHKVCRTGCMPEDLVPGNM